MRFKNCEGQIARWIETLSAYTFTVVHRAGRVHNNADSLSRRPCYNHQCKYCDRFERKYPPENLADVDKTAGKLSAVKKLAVGEGNIVGESEVTLPCVGSDHHVVVCPNDGEDHGDTLPKNGTIIKHEESVFNAEQNEFSGPKIVDDNSSGRTDHSTNSLEPGLTEVLSLEKARILSQDRVYPSMHAMSNSGWNGAGTHEISSCHSCCCCLRTAYYSEDWMDNLEDRVYPSMHAMSHSGWNGVGTHQNSSCHPCCCCIKTAYSEDWIDRLEDSSVFGCLFETDENPGMMTDAHAGVTQERETRDDQPRGLYENGIKSGIPNPSNLQGGHNCSHSTSVLCSNVSQLPGGSGQSTSSCEEANECIEITQDNIRVKQGEDDVLKHLIQWKRDGEKPLWSTVAPFCRELKAYWHEWETIELRDEILCKKRYRDVGNDAEYLFLMPTVLRKEAFRQLHASVTGGHLGRRKTYDKLRKRFYWCSMYKNVSYWCRTCSTCGSRKMPHRNAKAPMRQYNVGYPMERIGLDICGPYPVSKKGNRYLMVVSCYFTKWVDAIPLKSQEAKYVASKLVNRFISIFGVPLQLHTDLGSNFESKVFQEVCKLLGIDKTRTTVRRPQSDGMVERANRSIQNMISSYISDAQDDWDEHIPLLMLAYRSSIHETTGISPAMMMLGRELTLPVDMTLGRPIRDERLCATEHAYQLEQRLLDVHDFARKHLDISSESMKRRYDIKAHKIPYKVGDAVWYYYPKRRVGFNPKLQRPWKGPMIVVEVLNEVLFRIQSGPRNKPMVVHHDKLKPYLGEDKPDWFVSK